MSALHEQLEEQAALYAAGALTARERTQLELILRFHDGLRDFVRHLEEATALAHEPAEIAPCPTLKSRVLEKVQSRHQRAPEESFVLTNPKAWSSG